MNYYLYLFFLIIIVVSASIKTNPIPVIEKYQSKHTNTSTNTHTHTHIPVQEFNPKIFVINLKSRQDRRRRMQQQLKSANLTNVEFIDAVNGNALTSKAINEAYHYKSNTRKMRTGEIGCFLSHLSVYKKILQQNLKYAIVLEDDAVFGSNFKKDIEKHLKFIDEHQWDMILLGRNCRNFTKADVAIENHPTKLFRPMELGYGMHCYLITAEFAKKLLTKFPPFSVPIDVVTFGMNSDGTAKIYALKCHDSLATPFDYSDSDTVKINKY